MPANTMYEMSIGTFAPMLRTLSDLLDKGANHMREQKRDPDTLADARLAPDMFNLTRQVQVACDHAKTAGALLTGTTAPRFEDNEKTLAELKERIARTVSYIETVPATAFDGAAERRIQFPLRDGLSLDMNGLQFLRDWTLPHFYFHVVTAYDIIRHSGVPIGKRDYLAHVGYAIRSAA